MVATNPILRLKRPKVKLQGKAVTVDFYDNPIKIKLHKEEKYLYRGLFFTF